MEGFKIVLGVLVSIPVILSIFICFMESRLKKKEGIPTEDLYHRLHMLQRPLFKYGYVSSMRNGSKVSIYVKTFNMGFSCRFDVDLDKSYPNDLSWYLYYGLLFNTKLYKILLDEEEERYDGFRFYRIC